MRLLLVPDPTSPNGEDAFCREIAKRAGKRGHEAHVQFIPNGPLEATLDSLSATGFALSADAVFINSLQPAALLAAKAAGKKTAVRLIDTYAGSSQQALEAVKTLALKADLLLVPSKHMARVAAGWGANGQVREVPYAYDRVMAQQIALVTMRAAKPTFQMIACARLDAASQPGLETLLSAVARLRFDCHLLIVGEGPAKADLEEKARQMGAAHKVEFHAPMPHVKLMEFFRSARVFIDPSGLDGFPTLALYALSEGCPVIAARAGAVPELIHDQQNGLLFAPGDALSLSEAIVTLFSVKGLSLRLIQEGIQSISARTWDATVDAAFAAFESLVEKP